MNDDEFYRKVKELNEDVEKVKLAIFWIVVIAITMLVALILL